MRDSCELSIGFLPYVSGELFYQMTLHTAEKTATMKFAIRGAHFFSRGTNRIASGGDETGDLQGFAQNNLERETRLSYTGK
jgi:hypothetical protein